MAEDEKNPAREVITTYAQSHFRYFRTADGTVYAQRNGHPVARPIRSQGTTGSHRQELMVGMFKDGTGVF
ncbi:ATP-binding protein, partial [Streptomyces sp. NPDC057682]